MHIELNEIKEPSGSNPYIVCKICAETESHRQIDTVTLIIHALDCQFRIIFVFFFFGWPKINMDLVWAPRLISSLVDYSVVFKV